MNKIFKTMNLTIFFLCLAFHLDADVLKVPSQYRNIAVAYFFSSKGDVIEIDRPGTYLGTNGFSLGAVRHDISIMAKFPNTIIDLQGLSLIRVAPSPSVDVLVDNLTIKNTNAWAVINYYGKTSIHNCQLSNLGNGPAARTPIFAADLDMKNTVIFNCANMGNCIEVDRGNFDNCVFQQVGSPLNSSRYSIMGKDQLILFGCKFFNSGKVFLNWPFRPAGTVSDICLVTNCEFDNTSIRCFYRPASNQNRSYVRIENNTFKNNTNSSVLDLEVDYSEIYVYNNIFSKNNNSRDLCRLIVTDVVNKNKVNTFVEHNTFADNAVNVGMKSLLVIYMPFSFDLKNNIFWNPTHMMQAGSQEVNIFRRPIGGQVHTVEYNNFTRGVSGAGNISINPQFVDFLNGDYHLTATSPCKDAGQSSGNTVKYDFDYQTRSRHGTPDMGADEFAPHVYWTGRGLAQTATLNFIANPNDDLKVIIGDLHVMPLQTSYGKLLLDPATLQGPFDYGLMGQTGHRKYSYLLPGAFTISVQGLFGSKLTEKAATLTSN